MYRLLIALSALPLLMACERETAYSRLLTQEYPELYEYVFERNADSLLHFTSHNDEFLRAQAWRALINTPVENIDDFITKVQYANTEEAWMALSTKELSESQLTRLHNLWEERSTLRNGISRVLGKQGNQASLDFLVQNFDEIIDANHEFQSALAIGRLMLNYEMGEQTMRSILRYAAVIEDPELYRAYFYGLYRGNQQVENEDIAKAIWDGYVWVESPQIRQYILRISFNTDPDGTLEKLPVRDIAEMDVQLAVELAQQTSKVGWNEKLADVYRRLLEHGNPVVNQTALTQIQNKGEKPAEFDSTIESLIIKNEEKEASVRISGILALNEPSDYLELADELSSGNEYLLIKKLQIQQKALGTDEYLSRISELIRSENRMEVLFAAQALAQMWSEIEDSEQTSSRAQTVRSLIFELLGKKDRSITYTTVPFMGESGLINEADYAQIAEFLKAYQLPEDVEVYQVFGQFLKDNFEEEAQALIDSIAQKGNSALNTTWREQGWEIPQSDQPSKKFRSPNWKRLGELGFEPVWVLETYKGTIEIQMDVLSAPATISGIDSLTLAGSYNNIAFHRVVPNFVIQGGDVETGDGFGGPDYVVPTEGSPNQYDRGTVGIASAGTDTEGSQYFMMHDWAPHLNGRYTIIGEVISGMDVVDRIVVGDKVNKVYWQPRED